MIASGCIWESLSQGALGTASIVWQISWRALGDAIAFLKAFRGRSRGALGFEHFQNANTFFFLPTFPSLNFNNFRNVFNLHDVIAKRSTAGEASGAKFSLAGC